MMNSISQTDRKVYFDYLRVLATFAVMILHISAQNWYTTDVNGFDWQVFNFFDSKVRWAVPIFVMISGALFLNRDIPIKVMYSKYILRLVVSFVVWSIIYALFSNGSIMDRMVEIVQGHYHMWFIFMIIGLYMCIPFIKPIVQNEHTMRYFLVLAILFGMIVPEIRIFVNDFGSDFLIKTVNTIGGDIEQMNMHMVLGYVSYFVLGYYLNSIDLTKKQRTLIYIMGLLGFAATMGLDLRVALMTQTYCDHYYGYLTLNVFFEAVAVFTWFKYRKYNNQAVNQLILKLSKYSFGAYLVHALVIEQLDNLIGLNSLSFNSVISVPCIGIIVFVISIGISALLNHIPVVKKYM